MQSTINTQTTFVTIMQLTNNVHDSNNVKHVNVNLHSLSLL